MIIQEVKKNFKIPSKNYFGRNVIERNIKQLHFIQLF